MTYLVIGLCLLLLIIVVFISAKPISMGIEARRNIKDNNQENIEGNDDHFNENNLDQKSISDEILRLNNLKKEGLLTEEEYTKAKNKLLS